MEPEAGQSARLLAIETSDRHGSIAAATVASDGAFEVLGQAALPKDQRSAQSLAPTIEALLADLAWEPQSLDVVAAARGPGSFTGLRIGVTTAKTLAYATGGSVVGVNTLSALALASGPADGRIVAVIDAFRSELFYASFDDPPAASAVTRRVRRDDFAQLLCPGDTVVSPIAAQLGPVEGVGLRSIGPTGAAVARLAATELAAGRTLSPFDLSIDYCRASAAEEKLGRS